jgi:DNA-binding NtrC family response regulator
MENRTNMANTNPDDAQLNGGSVVAVVDDDPFACHLLRAWLSARGIEVQTWRSGAELLASSVESLGAVCLDLGLGAESGMDVLPHIVERDPELPVLVITAENEVRTAVDAMRGGAYDFLTKPLDRTRLETAVSHALDRRALSLQLRQMKTDAASDSTQRIVGTSAVMDELRRQIARVAGSDVPVCIRGESGTGKELVARAIHDEGTQKRGPFVAINCAAIPESLIESELFGHERGAFTGATCTRKGRFEQASGGTLFLDEVGEMSPATQARLLRALQERRITRIGGSQEVPIDARVICATHRDLEQEVREGRFREDLFYRLVVYPIWVPALRERPDDIAGLLTYFMKTFAAEAGRTVPRVDPSALSAMMAHSWPGNVRELQNVVRRVLLATDEIFLPVHLPSSVRGNALPDLPTQSARASVSSADSLRSSDEIVPLRVLEHRAIEGALRFADGSVGQAAKLLGIGRATLYRRLASYQQPQSELMP